MKIEQIGNKNSATAISLAEGVSINLFQEGNDNYLFSKVAVEDYQLRAVQKGNDNYFFNMPVFSEAGTQLEVIQEGNNQHVENNGANALSKSMKVKITGSDRMVIINNFK